MRVVAISLSRPLSPSVLRHGSFLAFWQAQSKLATIALFALLAVSVWLALAVILVWSIAATLAYYSARQRGVPDFLAVSSSNCRAARTGQMLGGMWLVGLSAFAFANVIRPLLRNGSLCRRSRLTRFVVLLTGLTLFGVTINQHMLQVAGYQGPKMLALSIFGVFLNVPYRIFCGALTLHVLLSLMNLSFTTRYV
jgi:hypothetical protein